MLLQVDALPTLFVRTGFYSEGPSIPHNNRERPRTLPVVATSPHSPGDSGSRLEVPRNPDALMVPYYRATATNRLVAGSLACPPVQAVLLSPGTTGTSGTVRTG